MIIFLEKLKNNNILPIGVFSDKDLAARTAELLLNNSIDIMEITLRTSEAYECIEKIRNEFPEMTIGAGSILTTDAYKESIDSGSQFGLSPGLDPELIAFSKKFDIPYVPGIATPSEMGIALKSSNIIKIFPAILLGGVSYIKSVIAPFKMKDFYILPTGGINESNFEDFLGIDRVLSCGMSYVVDERLVENKDFDALEKRIKHVSARWI